MSERIGNAEDFARLLGGFSKQQEEPVDTGEEPPQRNESTSPDVELDEEQRELAGRYGLPPQLVTRVRGETWAAKCEDAKRLAKLVREKPLSAAEEQGQERLRQQFGTANEAKDEANRAFVEMLHPPKDPP
jgi:hypothetical protein